MSINITSTPIQTKASATTQDIHNVQQTTCCIVGSGPAGAVLALILARQGIPVMLLEAHKDFDRDFRGDTIHPSVMEIMEELGLADRLLQLPHTKIHSITITTAAGSIPGPDFSHLKTRYPYIMMLPQVKFLEFITTEAQRYPHFQLVMSAHVQELINEDGVVRGVRYRGHGGWHEVRALLTIGADGRHSHLRQLASFHSVGTSPPMDVLWFRLPRKPEEPKGLIGRIGRGHLLVLFDRSESWQVAYVFPKGGYQKLRTNGLEALRQSITETVPEFSDRMEHFKDWSGVAFLSVESSRCDRWYRPGLLLIGDAAHVMSPVGGVGINYAIQDAVAAANVLSGPLKAGNVQLTDLAAVQRQREWPTRLIQTFQTFLQRNIIARALDPNKPFTPPFFLHLPVFRDILARLLGFGLWPAHVKI